MLFDPSLANIVSQSSDTIMPNNLLTMDDLVGCEQNVYCRVMLGGYSTIQ